MVRIENYSKVRLKCSLSIGGNKASVTETCSVSSDAYGINGPNDFSPSFNLNIPEVLDAMRKAIKESDGE